MTRLIRHHIALAVFFLSLVVAWAAFPVWRGFWMNEDQWIEWASFLFFAAAAFGLLLRVSPRTTKDISVGALCLLAALDEISFGERIFGFVAPSVGGVKIDGAHDLIEFLRIVPKEVLGLGKVAHLALLLVFVGLALWGIYHMARRFSWRWDAEDSLGVVACLAVAVAMMIDAHVLGFKHLAVEMEEILETSAGFGMFLYARYRAGRTAPETVGA
ncbi:MAG: hypothetical protein JXR15_16745 [Shimia sp.]|uniref:hypothetical protein n=1 Tax=Shimia sp. TaxID=1954381 RepID=UPI003B8E3639